jgi:hypothetical protein
MKRLQVKHVSVFYGLPVVPTVVVSFRFKFLLPQFAFMPSQTSCQNNSLSDVSGITLLLQSMKQNST